MPVDSSKSHRFARLLDRTPVQDEDTLAFSFDGRELSARTGDTVAAALLSNATTAFRTTPVSGQPRAPFCMMGVCFDCLVEIDGVPNLQACMIEVREGMTVVPMQGARTVAEGDDSA